MLFALNAAADEHWLLFSAVLSLCVGSFINVVVYRLPVMLEREMETTQAERFDLVWPRSFCPSCTKQLSAFDNIPLLSWLLLRGRCRYCRRPISVRYPLVELFLMLMGIMLAWHLGIGLDWFFMLAFVALLLALAAIDSERQLLPDCLTLSLLWGGLLWHCLAHPAFLPAAVIGAMAGYLTLWLLYWGFRLATGREGLGYGDFKLLAALGAWGGYAALPSILLFASAGSLLWLLLRVWRGGDGTQPLPFGPGLATAGAGAVACQWFVLPLGG
ncbi:type 4 prepilin peptidase 1 [Serratia marcescens]|uniref:Prepilin leader peptidase/N-methyltransferase n=1 Tax=Serratia marcescens TaxID=615 RepID=A0AA46K6Y9_SERMA|nr:A24 family peptidase [Serratia marcescens]TQI85761.1 type 4 prepilin peptidase 1 [Serratia marcescens]HEJ7121156.1 prepilin peptidase [Serratia marcescens]